jgi:hypothetical protein
VRGNRFSPTATAREALLRLERTRRDLRHRGILEEGSSQAQRLVDTRLDLFEVFRNAGELSRSHTATLLCRSLDILHVAAALQLGCAAFVSGDSRQLSLAKDVGLDPIDVKGR